MKIQILQEDLNKGLNLVSRAAATRGQLPVLANILFTAIKEGVQVSGTNLEVGLRASIGGKVSEEGQTTVPAKSITEFVNTLSSGTITLETDSDKLKISSTHSSAVFSGIPATEFPILPRSTDTEKNQLQLTAGQITSIASEVAFAAATDESRPVLTGVQFKPTADGIVVTATDGFRMSQLQVTNPKSQIPSAFILPSRTVFELAKLVQSTGEKEVKMQIVAESNQVIFIFEEVDLISRLLEGNFPDIGKIIPNEHTNITTIDREDLVKALKTTSIFARENNNIVKLKIAESKITITASAANIGENSSSVEADIDGEGEDISFNCKFMQDFLGSVTPEQIILKTGGATAPGVFVPEGSKDLIHLIMPVRI